jgi:hypothetical protein
MSSPHQRGARRDPENSVRLALRELCDRCSRSWAELLLAWTNHHIEMRHPITVTARPASKCVNQEIGDPVLPIHGLWVVAARDCDEMRGTAAGCKLVAGKNREDRAGLSRKMEIQD